ncbi:MAG: cell cycle protein [Chitinophagaceae bacterium]|nr:cell cycle protein [Chitinophagaceae bacterium]
MPSRTWLKERRLERFFLLASALVLALLFFKLSTVLKRDFVNVDQRLANGTMINLNDEKPAEQFKVLLQKGLYFQDPKDINLASAVVGEHIGKSESEIDNFGELNKKIYNINADRALTEGGESYKKRVLFSRTLLGFTGDDSVKYELEKKSPPQLPSSNNIGLGNNQISGTIKNKDDQPVNGVMVRLEMLAPQDSLEQTSTDEDKNWVTKDEKTIKKVFLTDSAHGQRLMTLSAYARSGPDGKFSFTGLPANKSFEVLPLQPGYQFGPSQGIAVLKKNLNFDFYQSEHTIKLLSGRDFNNLKKDKALIVRTPDEAMHWFWIIVGCFFGAFLITHLLLTVKFPTADPLILPIVMLLTGFSLITLFSLQDPIRDRFLAKSTLTYFGGGMLGLCVLMFINVRRFTTDSPFFRMFIFQRARKAANGWPWALIAIGLLALTIMFGTGPEGSGVKVNLFGFQPSEIVKFLLVLFLAGFFSINEKFIAMYSSWKRRSSFFGLALAAILITIFLFLILGDLGPAMVVCFTFIMLFSFSRGDFGTMVTIVIVYILSIALIKNVLLATGITVVILLLLMARKKQLSESSVMILVIMASFLLLDQVPYLDQLLPGPVHRLIDRKAIWQDKWDNEVYGGDQVANGIWAMSSGGVTGQGAGEGFAKTIPEAHTDMILPSFGEEFGWAGIVSVFLLFLLYLHRGIIIGRQTGTPFLFYLCSGIGIATFMQFLLIAGGSTGVLPLSGVSLPFMSYGGSSLLCNLLAAGFLLSSSKVKGTSAQMKFISTQQDKNLVPALAAACVGILLLTVNISRYLFNNKKWVVQPALVADRNGSRMFSYNPRINILMDKLQAGTLYDRKGRILAASNLPSVIKQMDSLTTAGIDRTSIEALAYKRLDRYYPFGEHMFFWTGDANTGVFNGSVNGFFAEYEYAPELRGFPAPASKYQVAATRFRADRFLPQGSTEMTVSKRDYSALAPLLLAGINSAEVEQFKKRNRDVQMTVDAALQTAIQKSISTDDSLKNNRISIVIREDNTGDVLASAMYPLPPVNDWEKLTLTERDQMKLPYFLTTSDLGFTRATQPGSTAKLVVALSAFNKLGMKAAALKIPVAPGDLIRINSAEPDEAGLITIERGIVKSNNPFFIKLANGEQLQEYMGTLYMQTGMFLHGVGGYYYNYEANAGQQSKWMQLWRSTEFKSLKRYDPNNIRKTRNIGISAMAWGQGELIATPASVARVASGIANNGWLIPNKYVIKINDSVVTKKDSIQLAKSPAYAQTMTKYMIEQSERKSPILKISVAGKTGTPERVFKGEIINDGWYVFFAPKVNGPGNMVVCIRVENCKGSSVAVGVAGKHVIPQLLQRGYIKSIQPAQPAGQPGQPVNGQPGQPQTTQPVTPAAGAQHDSAPAQGVTRRDTTRR